MRPLIPALFAVLVLTTAQAEPVGQVGPELKEVSAFKLDMGFLQHLSQATWDVKGYEDSHPDDVAKIETDPRDDTDTLDRRIARIKKLPAVVAILKKDGLTPYQYVVGGMSLLQASGSAVLVQMRGDDAWEDLASRGINTDNVRFYLAHQQQIEALSEPSGSIVPAPATR